MKTTSQKKQPKIIEGGLAIDERGQVAFANDFDFKGIKRFYIVNNHKTGFVRAWHGHQKEAKYAFVVQGVALVAAVPIKNWKKPSKKAVVHKHVLSAQRPQIFYIPPGYANNFMPLTDNTQVIFYSTATLEESQADDFRYPARYWNIWHIEEK